MHACVYKVRKRVRARSDICKHMRAQIFTKINLVVRNYLMSLSAKCRKDLCFRRGDIQLLVSMYISYYTLNFSQFSPENFDFFGTPS